MYKELILFGSEIAKDKALYRDGELWTSLAAGIGLGVWCWCDPNIVPKMREHFPDLLTVASIVFGFVLTTLFFHVEATEKWAEDPRIDRVAARIINWDVWAILSFLVLLAYIVLLWACGAQPWVPRWTQPWTHGFLGFQSVYCGCQILNSTLRLWWAFQRRKVLKSGRKPGSSDNDCGQSNT